ncbi:hypothetical protein B296_00003620 [Ensete ventricosum]|uniref:HORMA domain-containing protein n=1 Tax=Ensete ventricosum TaxID=4639 RepID=A0A427BAU4_ENSVE|nr:hypothetical protein B296_00003620 [Ensete ventricosum]
MASEKFQTRNIEEMKIKKLMPMDAESRRLIDWMEKGNVDPIRAYPGVYDALQKKYLKTLLFCICEETEGSMIEEKCCENEAPSDWTKTPLKMQVGNVNSRHVVLSLKVKSVLDPCEDENDGLPEDEEASLGDDSGQGNDSSSDSELFNESQVRPSLADRFIVAPIEEAEMQDITNSEKTCNNFEDDFVYMKALYYALPMDYVTISKLQSKLAGVANHSTVRKLIDKMEQDGYIKNTGNRRLGKRVIHSESSNRKLLEVKQFLEQKTMVMNHSGFTRIN